MNCIVESGHLQTPYMVLYKSIRLLNNHFFSGLSVSALIISLFIRVIVPEPP